MVRVQAAPEHRRICRYVKTAKNYLRTTDGCDTVHSWAKLEERHIPGSTLAALNDKVQAEQYIMDR